MLGVFSLLTIARIISVYLYAFVMLNIKGYTPGSGQLVQIYLQVLPAFTFLKVWSLCMIVVRDIGLLTSADNQIVLICIH